MRSFGHDRLNIVRDVSGDAANVNYAIDGLKVTKLILDDFIVLGGTFDSLYKTL